MELGRYGNRVNAVFPGAVNTPMIQDADGRVEARNVSIGMIRKRARGLLDTGYFKLKIRQAFIPEIPLGLYVLR